MSGFRDHTQMHNTRQDSSGGVISPTQRPLPDKRQIIVPSVSERSQTQASDRRDIGIGISFLILVDACGFIENGVRALV